MSKELQNKLYHYEVQPPAKAWDEIAAALDESHLDKEFPSTLYHLEANPPATAWVKIRSALDEEKPRRRIVPLLRYAAAAVFAGILIFSGIKLFRNTTNNDRTGESIQPLVKTEVPTQVVPTTTGNQNNPAVTSVTGTNPEKITVNNNTNAVAAINVNNLTKNNNTFISSANPVKELVPRVIKRERHETGISAVIAHNETPTNQMGRYITLMTTDGNIIRMSNKLSDLVCCVSGEDQDNDCKNQMNKWRTKIASSSQLASPGNFMDILNMINCLQEN